jgi:pyruvate formate lyase activating enzyme
LEVVTLLIPGFNDTTDELRQLAEFLASISPDIPWHVTVFHKDYKITDPDNTSAPDLTRAAAIGRRAGLRHVYAGNLPGEVGDLENTRCAACQELLIQRLGYRVTEYRITPDGRCPSCLSPVPGLWGGTFRSQVTDRPLWPLAASRQALLSLHK